MGKLKMVLALAVLAALLGFIALNMKTVEVNLAIQSMSVPVGFVAIGSALAGAFLTLILLVFRSKGK